MAKQMTARGIGRIIPRSARLCRFARSEDGSTSVMALFLLMVMLVVGGIAVDLMRYENNRARIQSVLDRAVLAAADLNQTGNPEDVVRDYFEKAGMLNKITGITVVQGVNGRTVSATAQVDLNPFFMIGVDSLVAPAAGAAAESINDIEIVMVLDVSGSMNSNNRIINLRNAAEEFVDIVTANDVENRISIAVVPFNGQVNLGAPLRSRYNAIDQHGVADVNCVDLPASVYTTQTISRTLPLPMTIHGDTFTGTTRSNAFYTVASNTPTITNQWCPPRPENTVLLPTRNLTTLRNKVRGLTAVGATSINAGMRWGMTLLDPAARPMFNELIGMGQMSSMHSDRPFDYTRENTMKIIVLMTDGEHFAEERANAGYRTGPSGTIWRGNTDANFSIFHEVRVNRSTATNLANSRPFWVPHLGAWHARPWNGTAPVSTMPYAEGLNRRFDVNGDGVCNNTDDGRGTLTASQACWGRATEQTWQQIWASVRMHWVAYQLYGRPLGTTDTQRNQIADLWMNTFRTRTEVSAMNDQLQTMCDRARNTGVIVFGVSFEAPAGGQEQIYNCSSSPNHYYNAAGLQISTAFRSIANQINALRLIQ
jgi:Flp pilus assembly protein TadG